MKKLFIVLVVLFGVVSQHALGAVQQIVCPSELPEASMKVISVPPGWKSYISSPMYLHNAAPIDGPPERLGTLIGKTVKESKTAWTQKYNLDRSFPDGKWFKCDYGMLNDFSLAKKLNDDTKECTVNGKKGEKAGQNVFEIICK